MLNWLQNIPYLNLFLSYQIWIIRHDGCLDRENNVWIKAVYWFCGCTEVERKYGSKVKTLFHCSFSTSAKSTENLTSVKYHCGFCGCGMWIKEASTE